MPLVVLLQEAESMCNYFHFTEEETTTQRRGILAKDEASAGPSIPEAWPGLPTRTSGGACLPGGPAFGGVGVSSLVL